MDEDWIYFCGGMRLIEGIKQRATSGYIGITSHSEVVLFNNKGDEFDRAPVTACEMKFNLMANTLKLPEHKYNVVFHPLSQEIGRAVGGALGGIMRSYSYGEDSRSEKEKRKQFIEAFQSIKA